MKRKKHVKKTQFYKNPLALAIGHLLTAQAQAAMINIDATPGCSLVDAITSANTDTATNACVAGFGADTIAFASGSTITG